MPYYVIDPNGTPYGPADLPLLQQWATEGRIQASSTIRDVATGQSMQASMLPGLYIPSSGPVAPSQSPYGQTPYGSSPYGPSPGYPNYPQPMAGNSSGEITGAWVCAIVGLVCAFCVCSLLGLGLGIVGVILARRAMAQQDPRAQGPLITSYAAIGLGAVMLIFNIFAIMAMRM